MKEKTSAPMSPLRGSRKPRHFHHEVPRLLALADEMNEWRGDPRLSAWEEDLLTQEVRYIRDNKGWAPLSPKVRAKIEEIRAKVEHRGELPPLPPEFLDERWDEG